MDLFKSLGMKIQKVRERRGLTQEELGNAAGLNAKYISSIERGKKNATLTTIAKVAAGLQIELYELFMFSEEPESEGAIRKGLETLIKSSDLRELTFCLDFLKKYHYLPRN